MSYTIALIDADNTLLDFSRSEHDALCDCLAMRGLPCSKDVTDRYAAINDFYWKQLEKGLVTREDLRILRFEDFCKEFGFDHDPVDMANDYMARLATKSYLMEGALDFCSALYGKCRLYLITNGNTFVQKGRFDPSPLSPLFEACFISEEMGCAKPEKAYFDMVTSAIPNFDPTQTIVIGDSISSDIWGGINAGLDTCWYNHQRKPQPQDVPMTYMAYTFDDIQTIVLSNP